MHHRCGRRQRRQSHPPGRTAFGCAAFRAYGTGRAGVCAHRMASMRKLDDDNLNIAQAMTCSKVNESVAHERTSGVEPHWSGRGNRSRARRGAAGWRRDPVDGPSSRRRSACTTRERLRPHDAAGSLFAPRSPRSVAWACLLSGSKARSGARRGRAVPRAPGSIRKRAASTPCRSVGSATARHGARRPSADACKGFSMKASRASNLG